MYVGLFLASSVKGSMAQIKSFRKRYPTRALGKLAKINMKGSSESNTVLLLLPFSHVTLCRPHYAYQSPSSGSSAGNLLKLQRSGIHLDLKT